MADFTKFWWNVSDDRQWAEVFHDTELVAKFRDDDDADAYVAYHNSLT